ncbi:hypothetical protein CY35_06G072500 [Sphagnum magellanicum]|nr:hypothetical protein CY35_06G072500 [Sphagnum magellanicum]
MKTIKQMRWKKKKDSLAHYEQQESRCRGERERDGERSGAPGARGRGGLKLGFLSVDWSKKLSSNKMAPRGEPEAFNDPTPTVAYNDRVRTILIQRGCGELITKNSVRTFITRAVDRRADYCGGSSVR